MTHTFGSQVKQIGSVCMTKMLFAGTNSGFWYAMTALDQSAKSAYSLVLGI